ncbi:MAG TPA: membrane protein insertase YidC, partial [Cyclobacteriaceae bacterium]|nr:membrane protein insertase YidC [Cyclobacteriaceae bacterium]
MDRNSAIGLTLIGAMLMVYFFWFAAPERPVPQTTSTPALPRDPVGKPAPAGQTAADSLAAITYGSMATAFTGEEKLTAVQTNVLNLTFSNRGGVIRYAELKNFKTYFGKPLVLIDDRSNEFALTTQYKGENLDLYALYYEVNTHKAGNTTIVTFSVKPGDGAELVQTYRIPENGYEIQYSIASRGFDNTLADQLTYRWNNLMRPREKDIADSRNNTTITYNAGGTVDWLTERSTEPQKESFGSELKWVTFKQKFFLTSLIAKNGFKGGEVETSMNEADTSVVKKGSVKLYIETQTLANGTAGFTYYLGPNEYRKIGTVAEKFDQNVYLGWPPVYWINKWVIFPVFYYLTTFIHNFGLIIIILVILIRLILLPLSYRSFLSMAKMKVLKPELDEIKEKYGDDMTKTQQEQMKLYQQVGVNPISGCIPLLLQMPILFAMFYLFPNTIELRQEHFLWAEDLSTYDSILNLPFTIPFYGSHVSLFTLLMTISTLVYTWQNNQMSTVQGPMKVMSYLMPVIFLFVLNSFPAGLSFYYFMSNIATFGQQAIIRRFVDDGKIRA